MFFASSEDSLTGNIYDLVKECAIYGDENDFSSIWVPERHFTEFGGVYNNPAILHAAIAGVTKRIRLYSGSVVVPLHDPVRIAEEWSMVDNLSNGRVSLSIAPGWNPNDFIFFPENYDQRYDIMYKNIEQVKRLWKGETVQRKGGNGQVVDIKIYPTPVQKRIPMCVTVSNSLEGFKLSGEKGYDILTALLDHTMEELAEKIQCYRRAREENGLDPKEGRITLMLHTYVGKDDQQAKEEARKPYCDFLKRNGSLLKGLAQNRGSKFSLDSLTEEDIDEFVNFLYTRFANTKGLIGDKESCKEIVEHAQEAGVDKITCLLDFGPPAHKIIENLENLKVLKESFNPISSSTL